MERAKGERGVRPRAEEESARRRLLAEFGVSHETLAKLEWFVEELKVWQRRINLVSPRTIDEVWTRHVLDSAQLYQLQAQARIWLDLGSGAGLPGLVLAALGKARDPLFHMHLVESNGKKAAFLRHVAARLELPVTVHGERIEAVIPGLSGVDVVTARALAPLRDLIALARTVLEKGAVGLFPKGKNFAEELTDARKRWQIQATLSTSVTDPAARIVLIGFGHGQGQGTEPGGRGSSQ